MEDKPLFWIGSSREDLRNFPKEVRRKTGVQLRAVQRGLAPTDFKPMPSVGAGVHEIRIRTKEAYRVFYVDRFEEAVMCCTLSKRKPRKPRSKTSNWGKDGTRPC